MIQLALAEFIVRARLRVAERDANCELLSIHRPPSPGRAYLFARWTRFRLANCWAHKLRSSLPIRVIRPIGFASFAWPAGLLESLNQSLFA